MKNNVQRAVGKRNAQAGMTLVETMVAMAVLLALAVGVMSAAAVAVSTTETQGHLAARTAEYAQDKMEQLMALNFCDNSSNTAPTSGYVTTNTGGSGLAGCGAGFSASTGGGLDTSNPVNQYADHLDAAGNPVAANGNWEYIRVWEIDAPTTSLKQITVRVQVKTGVGYSGRLPESTVVALKSYPF